MLPVAGQVQAHAAQIPAQLRFASSRGIAAISPLRSISRRLASWPAISASTHDEPEYQAMVAEIEADMAAQLARVREMERNGELELIPEASATPP